MRGMKRYETKRIADSFRLPKDTETTGRSVRKYLRFRLILDDIV